MSQSKEPKMLELTVLKAEGLDHRILRGYFVECTIGSSTKKTRIAKRSEKNSTVEWDQRLTFDVDDADKLIIHVKLEILLGKSKTEYSAEVEIGKPQATEVVRCLPLINTKSKSKPTNSSITIKCVWPSQLDAVEHAVDSVKQETAEILTEQSDRPDEIDAATSAGEQVESVAKVCGSLVGKLEIFNKVVAELSEIHPYVKAALGIVRFISEAVKGQLERDQKILSLVDTMDVTYGLIKEGDPLNKEEHFKTIFKTMAIQTVECGYFIQDYIKPNFPERMAESFRSGTDKAIIDFISKFTYLRDRLTDHAIVDTTVRVYRIFDTVDNINETIKLDHMAYADGMRFNFDLGCYQGTRKDIIENVIEWASNPDAERVFLLSGPAGSGKSAIAHSVATRFNELQRLGSSFFCSRSKPKDSKPEQIFINIARDIADQIRKIRVYLAAKTENRSLSSTQSITEQFNIFIKDAFVGLDMMGPLVIVIDALDECEGSDESRKTLMSILAKDTSSLPNKIRIFLTARSGDMSVEGAFGSMGDVRRVRLEDADRSTTRNDVHIFIGEKLKDIANDLREKHPKWQEELTGQSGGIFIWAATACNYILGENAGGSHLDDRYNDIRELRIHGGSTEGMEPVYDLYTTVLSTAFKRKTPIVMERFKKVLGIVVTASTPLSTTAIEELSEVGGIIISRLGALLLGWDDAKLPVQVLHASFPEFLTDKNFSSDFYIDDKYRHSQMAILCLELMNRKLRVNFCEFEDLYILYEDLPPEERGKKHISEALQYACCHWVTHIVQVDYSSIKDLFHHFLFKGKHLMHWIEAMSILQSIDVAKRSMRALFEWTKSIKKAEPTTHTLIYDCCRFLEGFTYPITLGPLHVYLSALPYVPAHTALYQLYSRISGLEPIVGLELKRNLKWSLLRSQLPTNTNFITSAFSSDGNFVVCMARSGEVQMYDFATSVPRGSAMQLNIGRKKKGSYKTKGNHEDKHGDNYKNANGDRHNDEGGDGDENENKSIIRAKYEGEGNDNKNDNAVDLWMIYNYATIALSPDCNKIAVSYPGAIEVWDMKSGAYIYHEEGFETIKMKIPIVFESNDVVLACRSNVDVCRLQLDSTKANVCAFATGRLVELLAFSPNGVYAAGVSMSWMRSVLVWNAGTKKRIARIEVPGYNTRINALGVSSSGSVAVAHGQKMSLWSRDGSVIWDKECPWSIREMLMPLSTECGHFVTNGYANQVWDMATGECRWHRSREDTAIAISPDGRFLVTDSGAIFSVTQDKEEPVWEPSNDAEGNKLRLEKYKRLKHMIVLPSGSIIAAGEKYSTVFVWDRLGEVDAVIQLLQANTHVQDTRISPDGLKLASRDTDDNILVWARATSSTEFKLLGSHKFEDEDAARDFMKEYAQWGSSKDSEASSLTPFVSLASQMEQSLKSADVKSDSTKWSPEDLFFIHNTESEWVTTAEGKKLWYIPEGFRSWQAQSSQSGHKIVVYSTGDSDGASVIIFKYTDNVLM